MSDEAELEALERRLRGIVEGAMRREVVLATLCESDAQQAYRLIAAVLSRPGGDRSRQQAFATGYRTGEVVYSRLERTPRTMLETIEQSNTWLNGYVWGAPMIVLLMGTGLLLTILTGAVQFRYLGFAMKEVLGKLTQRGTGDGNVSPFQADEIDVLAGFFNRH